MFYGLLVNIRHLPLSIPRTPPPLYTGVMDPAALENWSLEMVETPDGEETPAIVHISGYWLSLEAVYHLLRLASQYPEFISGLLDAIETLAEEAHGGG